MVVQKPVKFMSPNPASMEKHEEKDSLLMMAEVLDAQLRAKLVVLSCCQLHEGRSKPKAWLEWRVPF